MGTLDPQRKNLLKQVVDTGPMIEDVNATVGKKALQLGLPCMLMGESDLVYYMDMVSGAELNGQQQGQGYAQQQGEGYTAAVGDTGVGQAGYIHIRNQQESQADVRATLDDPTAVSFKGFRQYPHLNQLFHLHRSGDSKQLAVATSDSNIILWQTDGGSYAIGRKGHLAYAQSCGPSVSGTWNEYSSTGMPAETKEAAAAEDEAKRKVEEQKQKEVEAAAAEDEAKRKVEEQKQKEVEAAAAEENQKEMDDAALVGAKRKAQEEVMPIQELEQKKAKVVGEQLQKEMEAPATAAEKDHFQNWLLKKSQRRWMFL